MNSLEDFNEIPKGAWLRREDDLVVIGAVLRKSIFFNWTLVLFLSFFLYISTLIIIDGNLLSYLFCPILCLLVFYFLKHALMSTFGHVEIHLGYEEATVFSGIMGVGRTKKFFYKDIDVIEEYEFMLINDVPQYAIRISGNKSTFEFGVNMIDYRRKFVLVMLRTFMVDGENIRNSLPVDLMRHLIE